MKYDTHNIDEATYLVLQGHHFTVTRTGPISAVFSFEVDRNFDEVRAKFWTGEVTVQLHRWLATRTALKHECAGQALSAKRRPLPAPSGSKIEANVNPGVTTGVAYWYRDEGTVKRALFGNRPLHTSRLAQGNFFRTREDAELGRNAVSVVDTSINQRS